MKFLFLPAIAAMNRMNFIVKFVVIGLLLLLPFAYVTHLMTGEAEKQIIFNQKESYGVQYIVPCARLLASLQACRTCQAAVAQGHAPAADDLEREEEQVDRILPAIARLDALYQEDLKTADGKAVCSERLEEVKTAWGRIRRRDPGSAPADGKEYTVLCGMVTDWILNRVGNYSNLILDPDLDSYWLMDAFVSKLPELAEILSQSCAEGLARLSAGPVRASSSFTDERLRLAGYQARAQDLLEGLTHVNLKTAYDFNRTRKGELESRLDPLAREATRRCTEFLEFVTEWVVKTESSKVTAADLLKRSRQAQDALYAFYESVAPELDRLILARVAAYQHDKKMGMFAAETATFLHVYLFIAFYIAIHASVAKLHRFTQSMIQGTTERFQLDSRDELGKVAGLYNEINVTLNQTRMLKEQVESQSRDLRASEARFRLLSEEAPIGILQWDARGECVFANARWQSLTGRKPGDWKDAVHPDDAESVFGDWKRVVAEKGSLDRELRLLDAASKARWGHLHVAPLISLEGMFAGFVGTVEDVTARRQAEEDRALREVQLRQVHRLESIGQLAAGIAHEINTPIQYVGDNIRFLEEAFGSVAGVLGTYERFRKEGVNGKADAESSRELDAAIENADLPYLMEEVPKAIRQSMDGVDRVTRIVRAMKEFSHPGVEGKTPTDLARAIETTVTVTRNEWKYVAEVTTDFDPTLPLVPLLPGDFNQVILNLIVNAAHAIGDNIGKGEDRKGAITIRSRKDGDWAEVRITDTGTGIPEAVRHRMFEPFFTTKPMGKGTGQGLALSHGVIVKKHGGTLAFETEVGKGTTFILRLPLTAGSGTGEAAVPADAKTLSQS